MTNKTRRLLVATACGFLLAGTMMIAPSEAPANGWGSNFGSVCLNVTDHGSSVMTLRVQHRYMLDPGQNELRTVKAMINSAEPGIGVSARTGHNDVTVNFNGTVAGFFTAMTFHWNPSTNSGTGRVASELSVHPTVVLTQFTCP